MWHLNIAQTNLSIKQTHRHREQICGCQGGEGRGMDGEFGVSRCKLLHLEWISSEVLVYSTGNSIQSLVIEHDESIMRKRMSFCCTAEIDRTL